jgi:hypothetical protein
MNAYLHHNQRPALTPQEATHPIATKKQRMHEKPYAFRSRDSPSQDSMSESSSLSDQEAVLCAADSGIGQ